MFATLFGKKNGSVARSNGDDGPLIQLRQVVKTYSNAAGDFTVLKGIDADFYRGEFVGVIGKSGSGKSTLINMITGIDRPTDGEVIVAGTPVHALNQSRMAEWRGRNLGIVFQFFQLLPMLSLLENIMLPMDFCHMYTPAERKERALHLLRLVEMEDHANKLPSAISGGQQQRVAIARALANDPPILIADEPTGNLDSRTSENVFRLFEDLVSQNKTVVMVTHDTSQAERVSRTVLIADGQIVNEYVARALPLLTHEQMLDATRQAETLRFHPGETIIQQGSATDRFYIVTHGTVEVALRRPDSGDVVVNHMREGEYFGEVEVLRGGRSIATVRASEAGPVEVLALERDEFMALMGESEGAHEAVQRMAQQRIQENIASGGGGVR